VSCKILNVYKSCVRRWISHRKYSQSAPKLLRSHANQMETIDACSANAALMPTPVQSAFYQCNRRDRGSLSAVIQICRWQEECCCCFLKYDTFWLVFRSSAIVVSPPTAVSSICQPGAIFPVVTSACTSLLSYVRGPAAAALVTLSSQLSYDIKKRFFDIDTVFCRCLDKVASKILGQGLSFLRRNLALGNAITLVAHEHYRCLSKYRSRSTHWGAGIRWRASHGGLLDALDLAVKALYAGKRGTRRDAVDEHEPFTVAYPLVSQCNVLFLAGCIEDLEHTRLAVNLHLLPI
jgi:hypothetical protein